MLAEAIDVPEPMGHDDNAGAQRKPKAASRRLQSRGNAESCCRSEVVFVAREPSEPQSAIRCVRVSEEREGTFADSRPAAEDPQVPHPGNERAGYCPEGVEREGSELLRIPRRKAEPGHGGSIAFGGAAGSRQRNGSSPVMGDAADTGLIVGFQSSSQVNLYQIRQWHAPWQSRRRTFRWLSSLGLRGRH
jgi:hypothetical protein